ncbi:hypothetical protein CEXT_242731 [Caerostris extrusa]|uniref:Uncharacterized protein n=1 Tax=Caerostris extrusa TaxID=172846 RepID=A0AAV4VDC4_CAEEX|nr:hypothetical protein CEXT_242731 [Caerostris extrusa]
MITQVYLENENPDYENRILQQDFSDLTNRYDDVQLEKLLSNERDLERKAQILMNTAYLNIKVIADYILSIICNNLIVEMSTTIHWIIDKDLSVMLL